MRYNPLMPRVVPLVLAVLLTFHAGCASVSDNNRRGMLFAGGASMFIGAIITADTLSCDDSVTNAQDCREDRKDLIGGLSLFAAGAVLTGLALYLRSRDTAAAAPAAPAAAQK